MKTNHITSLLLSALLIALTGPTLAQAPVQEHEQEKLLSRQQIIKETEVHLAMHDWDSVNSVWRLKPGMDLPQEPNSRAAALAAREQFLNMNRWDESQGAWLAIKGAPRVTNQVDGHQLQQETARFMQTHRYDQASKTWRSI